MKRTTVIRNERGMALPVALFALVVIGALVAGIFFTARIEIRSGENAMSGARAMEAAQAGLQMGYPAVLTLAGNSADGTTIGTTKTQLGTTGSYYQDSVTKLNRYIYLLRSYGTYEVNGNVTSTRVVAMLIKRYMPELNINSAASIVGTPQVASAAVTVDGTDHTPTGWTTCDPPGASEPAIRTNSSTTDIHKKATITPSVSVSDTTVTNMSSVLDTLFFQLASQANIRIPASGYTSGNLTDAAPNPNTTGTCLTGQSYPYNWGEPVRNSPARACENYFPIIYINALNGTDYLDVRIGGRGQGVLLINGNMQMNANSTFDGLILVRGQAGKANGTANINGSIISQNAELATDGSAFGGTLTINFSRCAVKTALQSLSVAAPATYRGFIQF